MDTTKEKLIRLLELRVFNADDLADEIDDLYKQEQALQLLAGLNDERTTKIERTLFNIFDKYHITPMSQPNLAIEILKACDAELESR